VRFDRIRHFYSFDAKNLTKITHLHTANIRYGLNNDSRRYRPAMGVLFRLQSEAHKLKPRPAAALK